MPSTPSSVSRRALIGGAAASTLATASVASASSAYAGSSRSVRSSRSSRSSRPRGNVILLALDGFDREYLDGRVALPHLESLLRRGSLSRSTGVMTSITNPSWTSVACGTYPDRTKNAAYWFDTAAGVARGQSRDSAVEGIGQSLRRQGRTIGSSQWFILQGKGVDYGDPQGLYTQPGGRIDARVDDAIAMLTGQPVDSGGTIMTLPEPPDFLAVYSSDVDGDGHSWGPSDPRLLDTLRETDAAIGRLITAVKDADLWGRTTWLVTADHGMSNWRIPLGSTAIERLAAAGFRAEYVGSGGRVSSPDTDVVFVGGGSIASVHLLGELAGSASATARVAEVFAGIEGVSGVFTKDDQRAMRMAPQYGELVVETREPYALFVTVPAEAFDGRHGGRAELDIPLILSGHRVRPGVAPRSPRHVDLAATISHLLGVAPPAASEGRVLREALLPD
ncbi:putative AlkP superfamily pyrophosphatase or phosphodiesterase [Knoellia remsis]|uniref:Putative AlkP superfamily pyrophosphatase or phosphodiesterase n=1 Tax=Knoellia remsis TaxID=407159 RepID=A0A2T0UGP2_9MICO|nr:alkaline phosphatase family protein [Knoellia remsis]PRY57109.1 putative AlkP superfamily pyrophosphatase or phosphodiesterase [Knoellia remsis]